ncbi:uncharacterized protein ACBT57_016334 isoform 1-T1 [Dama dama]|uniref:uncharacterized protein LOC133062376 n=1 Tax=Dama dama TaxID=30532 RepID=UPI002A371953|nr:uncharacterized protein LOC133062376 [Dama dama]
MALLNRQDKGVCVTCVGPVLMPGARYRMWWGAGKRNTCPGSWRDQSITKVSGIAVAVPSLKIQEQFLQAVVSGMMKILLYSLCPDLLTLQHPAGQSGLSSSREARDEKHQLPTHPEPENEGQLIVTLLGGSGHFLGRFGSIHQNRKCVHPRWSYSTSKNLNTYLQKCAKRGQQLMRPGAPDTWLHPEWTRPLGLRWTNRDPEKSRDCWNGFKVV